MKTYDCKPWPESSLVHAVPMTAIERWDFCVAHSATTPPSRKEESSWREAFQVIAGPWADDWETIATKGLAPERFGEITQVRITKAILRGMISMFEATLKQRTQIGSALINGNQARHINEAIERCEWAQATRALSGTTVKGRIPKTKPEPKAEPEPEDDVDRVGGAVDE